MANLQKCKDAKHEVYVIKYLYFIILMVRLQCFTLQFFTLGKEYVMKKFIRKALASMLVFTMCFSSVNISAFAQNVDEIDTTTEVVIEQTTDDTIEETTSVDESISESETDAEPTTTSDNSGWDQTTKEKIFEGENFKVYFTLSSNWDAGYNATIKLENTGDESIQNWYLGFEYADSITNIWNAEISSNENGYYTIKNVGWNQNIAVGQSIEFGITSNEGFSGFPLKYELLGQISNVNIGDYNINYILTNDWETGFSSTITINNDSDTDFEDWVLEFDFDRNITEIWNGIIEKHEGNHYVVKNATYNANIVAGQSVSFGFNGDEGSLEDAPKSYLLYSYKLYNGKSMEIDTDNDGLVDGVENLLGLNYKEKDSDGDGLDDYFEYSLCGLNPLEKDTDGDGVLDGDEDCDEDELSNALESYYNTDPLVKDTDNDGLNDYEEVITYLTNPLCIDTDEDELSDYDDVKLGFSPLNKDSDDDGTIDSQEIVKQTYEQVILDSEKKAVTKVSLDMSTNGNIENTCAISNTYNIDKMSSDVVGLVGVPVEINCSSNFEKATITFWYDKDELGDVDEKDLAVMWHDVDNHCYRLLDEESIVNTEKGTVSYVTTHFSTYMLVDRNKWYDAWKQNLDYRTSVSDKNMFYDFAFVIDVSGSMSGARISTAKEGKYVLMYSDPLLVDTDSDGIIDSKDDKPWTYNSVKNLLIYQSPRPKGLNADCSVAADMKYGQTTRSDILNINKQFKYQLEEADSENWGANTLFSEFEDMSTSLFSTGEMENVIKNMILHFKEGSGSDYSNATLTQEAYKHKSTQKYINDIKGEVIRRLKNNGGNIYDLEFTEEGNQSGKSIYNWAQQNVSYPRFHENSDIIHGLTICVNDTWGNTVEVKDYNFDGEHFSGTLHFCIYDHFGLDQPDVEKTYVNLAGFRAWYVLQHYDYFNGSFVPFVTLMEFDVPFESDIIMFKPGK